MPSIWDEFAQYKIPDDRSLPELEEFARMFNTIAYKFYKDRDGGHKLDSADPQTMSIIVDHPPPTDPLSVDEMTRFIKKLVPNFFNTHSKHFLGYIPSDPTVESMIMASLTPFFNQFTGSVQGSPGGVAVEALVITWIAELLGYPKSSFGTFTSGGSMANLTAIYTGLVHQLTQYGVSFRDEGLIGSRRPIIYFSDQTHNAIEKALLVLGLGRKSMRILPSNEQFQLTVKTVKQAITEDLKDPSLLPLMIIATAGTTNTGSIDHLADLYHLSREHNLWYHVDGAYGAFSRLSHLKITSQIHALPLSDSIALDCHKWFYTPFEAGITLVREHQIMKVAYDLSAEYYRDSELEDDIVLQRNFRSYSIQLTREMRGLKVWGVFAGLGLNGIRNAITRDILKAKYLRMKIRESSKFELIPGGQLSIVCFQYRGDAAMNDVIIEMLNDRGHFFVSSTRLRGKSTVRVCFLNRRSDLSTVDGFYDEIEDIVSDIHNI